MSLINDALKRTKDAQQQNPPPAGGPPLKPVDAATAKSASNSKSLLYIMVACVVLGNALLFLALKDRGAKTDASPATVPAAAPAIAAAVPSVAASSALPPPKTEPAVITSLAPVVTPVVVETNSAEAAPVVAVQPEPPKPAPLKLQSIIYNPSRPSAMVSGKFLFIGDRVQGFRVTAIEPESVTLVGNGQTNTLSLP